MVSEKHITISQLEEPFARRTSSRRAVLDAVAAWPGHFSAEELCKTVPRAGRATVYRTLASLQEAGILCRVMVDNGSPRYELGGGRHHHHLVCVDCGQVQDIAGCGLDDFVERVSRRFGYETEGHRLEVYGRCARCRDTNGKEGTPP
ncbi:MAG: transcriptional repressor [SAR202 cluster bacterium]|nr:transcriptional repressor [SAR202 cluster bacterium]